MRNALHFARTGQGKGIFTAKLLYELGDRSLSIYKKGINPGSKWIDEFKKYPEVKIKKNKAYGVKRMICCNFHVNELSDWYKRYGQFYYYWDDPKELLQFRHCDVIIDEIGNIFPADGWKDTPKSIRKFFTHFRKRGVEIFSFTQDYGMVDINYRRIINIAYQSFKVIGSPDISATLPEIKHPWGLITRYELDIEKLHRDQELDRVSNFPSIAFIRKKYTTLYDTTEEINVQLDNKLSHLKKTCPECGFIKVIHQ